MGIFEDPRKGIDRRATKDTHAGDESEQRSGLERRRYDNDEPESPWWLLRQYVNKTRIKKSSPSGS